MSIHRILNDLSTKYGMNETMRIYDRYNTLYREKHFMELLNDADKYVKAKNNVFERYIRINYMR